ncbi:putative WD repeat-containing protein C18B5.10c [Erysiphe neolycopersici]|uniref:Putative WD repeat-containing protein C18B5.10c n=1 Tax=Erysiphe neolycopersici TaxID=212602 RepID=A0A420I0Z6_9PEZI|nr:putative WD repeat-containing protein C18B5.10c [Erysiphe neolycopersici]
MAPLPRQRLSSSIGKGNFSAYLSNLKTQSYHEPTGSRMSVSNSIRSIAWNPLGTLIATGALDGTIRVWNPEKPKSIYSTELNTSSSKGHHRSAIEKVSFNPVKDAELCSVSSDGVIRFWDVRSKAIINEVKGLGETFTLAWAPNGESLIVGNKVADNLFILSPTQSTYISSHQQNVQTNQITFCYSGKKVFMTTGEGRVKILSYPEFKPIYYLRHSPSEPFTINGHTSSCLTVELQPNARFLATGGSDSIIALWDTTDWICQRTLTEMTGPVRSISFSFDGSYIVGGSDEGSGLDIIHTETGEQVHSIKTPGGHPCTIVSWHPSKYWLAYTDLGGLKILGVDVIGDRK